MQISAACENHISLLSFFWTGNDIGFFSTTNEVRISEGLRVEFEAEMIHSNSPETHRPARNSHNTAQSLHWFILTNRKHN